MFFSHASIHIGARNSQFIFISSALGSCGPTLRSQRRRSRPLQRTRLDGRAPNEKTVCRRGSHEELLTVPFASDFDPVDEIPWHREPEGGFVCYTLAILKNAPAGTRIAKFEWPFGNPQELAVNQTLTASNIGNGLANPLDDQRGLLQPLRLFKCRKHRGIPVAYVCCKRTEKKLQLGAS